MKKREIEEESSIPEYTFGPIISTTKADNERDKVEEQEKYIEELESDLRKQQTKYFLLSVCSVIFILITIASIYSSYISAKETAYIDKNLNSFCRFAGYSMGYRDEIALYCLEYSNGTLRQDSLMDISAPYMDYWYGAKQYDIREYNIKYETCKVEPEITYYKSAQKIVVDCAGE